MKPFFNKAERRILKAYRNGLVKHSYLSDFYETKVSFRNLTREVIKIFHFLKIYIKINNWLLRDKKPIHPSCIYPKYKTPVFGEIIGKCSCGGEITTVKIDYLHFNKCGNCGE